MLRNTDRGSPPQVRGKLFLVLNPLTFPGITPAGAGKTSYPSISRGYLKDHPRRCGENREDKKQGMLALGSPPQVRGKQNEMPYLTCRQRITPAGAGKTDSRVKIHGDEEDHPRRCGENPIAQAPDIGCIGSPPQVRGKHSNHAANDGNKGITPAGAGKTSRTQTTALMAKDHPRRCGENLR